MAKHRERQDEDGDRGGKGRRPLPRVSPWRRALLVASLLIAGLGLGLWAYAAGNASDAPPPPAPTQPQPTDPAISPQGLVPFEPPSRTGTPAGEAPPAEPVPSQLEQWSPAVFRLGFSFFAGFCIAYALRAFLKITIIVIGAALLGLVALQYAGLVNVNWGALEGVYDSVAAWLGTQTESFSRLVTGYLPSAASGAAGFAAGFTTRR